MTLSSLLSSRRCILMMAILNLSNGALNIWLGIRPHAINPVLQIGIGLLLLACGAFNLWCWWRRRKENR